MSSLGLSSLVDLENVPNRNLPYRLSRHKDQSDVLELTTVLENEEDNYPNLLKFIMTEKD